MPICVTIICYHHQARVPLIPAKYESMKSTPEQQNKHGVIDNSYCLNAGSAVTREQKEKKKTLRIIIMH